MNVVSICIRDIKNVEAYINKLLTNNSHLPLLSLDVNVNNITFKYGEFGDVWSTVLVKQYSKKDFSNRTIRKEVNEFLQENKDFNIKRIIGKRDFWLVFLVKDNQR